jgi:hypothetical protein
MTRLLSVLATREVIHLTTTPQFPPIPIRHFDWSAIDSNTYDADCDQEGYFSNSPQGSGETEAEAINDLLEQLEAA